MARKFILIAFLWFALTTFCSVILSLVVHRSASVTYRADMLLAIDAPLDVNPEIYRTLRTSVSLKARLSKEIRDCHESEFFWLPLSIARPNEWIQGGDSQCRSKLLVSVENDGAIIRISALSASAKDSIDAVVVASDRLIEFFGTNLVGFQSSEAIVQSEYFSELTQFAKTEELLLAAKLRRIELAVDRYIYPVMEPSVSTAKTLSFGSIFMTSWLLVFGIVVLSYGSRTASRK